MSSIGTILWGCFWPIGTIVAVVITLIRFKKEGAKEGTPEAEEILAREKAEQEAIAAELAAAKEAAAKEAAAK